MEDLFDRDQELETLRRFVATPGDSTTIGIVYGRRRVGKSFLLRHLAQQVDGSGAYYQALQQEQTPTFQRLGAWYGERHGVGAHVRDRRLGTSAAADPQQSEPRTPARRHRRVPLSRSRPRRHRTIIVATHRRREPSGPFPRGATRLVLCGSAMSVMSSLLDGAEALHGRAQLQLAVRPFGYRLAAEYWRVDHDPKLAFTVHTIVGGAPGYHDVLANAGQPSSPDELGEWLAAGVLDPGHTLFREDEYLLAEDRGLSDRAMYLSIMSAIAGGEQTVRGIASIVGRDRTALGRPLAALVKADLLTKTDDAFLQMRPRYSLSEPLVQFIHSITLADLARWELRDWQPAWVAADQRWRSSVLGPHFERICSEWTAQHAAPKTTGGEVTHVHHAVISCPEHRKTHELDVVAKSAKRVVFIGEAKYTNQARTPADVERLEHCRSIIQHHNPKRSAPIRLGIFAGNGRVTPDLIDLAARRDDLELIDLDRLYHRS